METVQVSKQNKSLREVMESMSVEYMNSQAGITKLANAMINPIRQRLYGSHFYCDTCRYFNPDEKYDHSDQECAVFEVMLS